MYYGMDPRGKLIRNVSIILTSCMYFIISYFLILLIIVVTTYHTLIIFVNKRQMRSNRILSLHHLVPRVRY